MRGDRNAVPLGTGDLQDAEAALRAQACELIGRLPPHLLVAILPVLEKYAPHGPRKPRRRGPDRKQITIHHPPRRK